MKSPNHLDKCIVCPKCLTKTMRKSIPQVFGKEYFDDKCHSYFGVNELVNQFGYDASELFPYYPVFPGYYKRNKLVEIDYAEVEEKLIATTWFDGIDTVSVIDEPQWKSTRERMEAYYEVTLMQMGIPAWALEDCSVDTGALHA